jgi:hypothetical protein
MGTGPFGTWTEFFDVFAKVAPAASIVAGLLAARVTFRNNRQISAEAIAKNHYREALEQMTNNAEIYYRGVTPTGFEELKRDLPAYRKYRMLATVMGFALQEIYLAIDLEKDKHWEQTVRVFLSMFKHYFASEADFPTALQQCLDPRFWAFLKETVQIHEHPSAKMVVAEHEPVAS